MIDTWRSIVGLLIHAFGLPSREFDGLEFVIGIILGSLGVLLGQAIGMRRDR